MEKISVLDCTLRDGGYVNQWEFGEKNIPKILNGLEYANIDIIECGFLTNRIEHNKNLTKVNTIEEIENLIHKGNKNRTKYVCMINFGEYNIEDIPHNSKVLYGIRVAFHKKDLVEAIEFCEEIKKKGYQVFVQPMVTMSYTQEELTLLMKLVNKLKPYAVYIADSFGVMRSKDLMRLFYIMDYEIDEAIHIGYHSHNNQQLALSNAQSLTEVITERKIIIDTSVFGIGRGAGNLNTELFVDYLNGSFGTDFKIKPLMKIIDQVLNKIYLSDYWGYSLPHYLSAQYNCHPNYASYLDDKKTLTYENMDEVLAQISEEKKNKFDKSYIENLYIQYMNKGKVRDRNLENLKQQMTNKTALIIAPGKSAGIEKEKILMAYNPENTVLFSINFNYEYLDVDYIFISNMRRYEELEVKDKKLITTSNIDSNLAYISMEYADLLNEIDAVKDNAGLMLIKMLIELGVKNFLLAGFDGYSIDSRKNFINSDMTTVVSKSELYDRMNSGFEECLKEFSKKVSIKYITSHLYINF